MKLKYISFLALIILLHIGLHHVSANDPTRPYAVSNIPKNLLLNANAVMRYDQMVQIIESTDQSKVKVKRAITLLNEQASKYRFTRIPYNKLIKISNIKAYVYDSNGDLIATAKPSIRDVSGNYSDLASDDRFWTISFPVRKYPFTIELEYEKTSTGLYISEGWSFQSQPDVAVAQSGIQLVLKNGLRFRAYGENLAHTCDTVALEDKTVYTWQESNLPAKKTEDLFLASFSKKIPLIITSPAEIDMGGLKGNMESWESYGKYFYDLNKDRDIVSEELQAKMRQLISNTTDKKEIVKKLFRYLQNNTRYVSIQLGIGGHQTLEASFVEKKGYGDCKALTNYMKSLLKTVGIPSYQALISNGDDDIITSFPGTQFNHVVLCVPLSTDTVWLECTNQRIPFNFLGSSNSNKHVLLLTENGGKLVKTPNYRTINNSKQSNFNVSIDIVGNATLKGKITNYGVSYEIPKAVLNSKKEEKEEYINYLFASPNLIINNIDFKEEALDIPNISLSCNLIVRDFVSKTSKRMVFNPYLFDPAPFLSKFDEEDFLIESTKTISDSIIYTYPVGYIPEYIPAETNIESRFGKFKYSCTQEKDKIIATRRFEYYANTYGQKDIQEFVEFINKIATSERQLVILKKE